LLLDEPINCHDISLIVGGVATPIAWKTFPQVPAHSVRTASDLFCFVIGYLRQRGMTLLK